MGTHPLNVFNFLKSYIGTGRRKSVMCNALWEQFKWQTIGELIDARKPFSFVYTGKPSYS